MCSYVVLCGVGDLVHLSVKHFLGSISFATTWSIALGNLSQIAIADGLRVFQ